MNDAGVEPAEGGTDVADYKDPWAQPGRTPDHNPGFSSPPTPPPPPLAPSASQPAPGYSAPPPMYAQPPTAKNWMGIVALVASLVGCAIPFGSVVGIVFGHLGLSASKRGEASNAGMALAGLIVGYVVTGLYFMFFVFLFLPSLAVSSY